MTNLHITATERYELIKNVYPERVDRFVPAVDISLDKHVVDGVLFERVADLVQH